MNYMCLQIDFSMSDDILIYMHYGVPSPNNERLAIICTCPETNFLLYGCKLTRSGLSFSSYLHSAQCNEAKVSFAFRYQKGINEFFKKQKYFVF